MKFGVLGAGAIGGWLGGRLAHAGEDVTLIARGPHLEAMRTKGVTILEPDGLELVVRPRCSDDLKLLGSADVVFVTVKAHSLPGLARDLGNAVSPEAALVFVQDGLPWWYFIGEEEGRWLESVDPGHVIARSVDPDQVVGAVVYPAATVIVPGLIRHEEGNRVTLAEPDGSRSERLYAISTQLVRAGLRAPISTHIRDEIWLKLVGDATLDPLSALTRATVGDLLSDPGMRTLALNLMREVEAVARSVGVELPLEIERHVQGAAALGAYKTSMLQDLEAGRPLEVEAVVGSVIEAAGQGNVATPRLGIIYELIRALDRSLWSTVDRSTSDT